MIDSKLNEKVMGLAIKVHTNLRPGLLETAYKECLFYELYKAVIHAEKEKPLPLIYENIKLDCGYSLDILAGKQLVLEIKSVDALNDLHTAQVLTYFKGGNYKFGLLINNNILRPKDGIKRIIELRIFYVFYSVPSVVNIL